MKDFYTKFWQWLINRSPKNAAVPNVQPNPKNSGNASAPMGAIPFETYIETENILGSTIKIGSEEESIRTPDGQLFRSRNKVSLILGACSHIAGQIQAVDQQDRHIKGIAGKCFYCEQQVPVLLQNGQISLFDAERWALVCTDCGKITTSGKLCCPKHYTQITNPDGTIVYIDPDDALRLERQNTVKGVLNSLASLFSKETTEQNTRGQDHE